jgi:acyl transferase domain-containing protein/acyl carrier protein
MTGVSLPEEEVNSLIRSGKDLSLAAVNGPRLCVVSGPYAAVEGFENRLQEEGHEYTRLHTSHAFHSSMMEPILMPFKEAVAKVKLNPPQVKYMSNVTGQAITAGQCLDPAYWADHLRRPVRFADGLKELLKEENSVFVEVGPGRMLTTFLKKTADASAELTAVNLVKHPKEKVPDRRYLLEKIGGLWGCGTAVDWAGFHGGQKRQRVPLPLYPFETQRFWIQEDPLKGNAADVSGRTITRTAPDKKKEPGDWFYLPTWKQSVFVKRGRTLKKSIWLVLIDDSGIGSAVIKHLVEKDQEVVTIKAGSQFSKAGEDLYVLDPHQGEHYHALIKELLVSGKMPDEILHLWNITGRESSGWEMGFYSLLYLAQALGNQDSRFDMRLTVVSDNLQEVIGDEQLCPHKAALLGPLNVIPQEYPGLRCRSIDIEYQEPQTSQFEKQMSLLAKELFNETSDHLVALRRNRRWVRDFEPLKLEHHRDSNGPGVFRQKGVYLITGGTGNIGLIVAEHLAKSVSARMVLTGRSPFPEPGQWPDWLKNHGEEDRVSRKIRKLQELKSLGAEVLVIRADVSDEEQMRDAVSEAEARFGPVNGVIHAAGLVNRDTFVSIDKMSQTLCADQFKPKIEGVHVLATVLRDRKPDFCLLMSSLSSILGGLGHAAYSAANNVMDQFVHLHNRGAETKWTCVNWDAWHTDGKKETAIAAKEGVEALQRILAAFDGGQVAVSTYSLKHRIQRWINLDMPEMEMPEKKKDAHVLPGNGLEIRIADMWQELLGVQKIGVNDNFFDLGATSLDIIQVNKRLMNELGKNISLDTMFEYPTAASLAKHLDHEETSEEQKMISGEKLAKSAKRMENTFKTFNKLKNG